MRKVICIVTACLAALTAQSANAFFIQVGRTTIQDGGPLDLNKGTPNVIQFALRNQVGTPGRFSIRGTATQKIAFGDDRVTSITLSNLAVNITALDPRLGFASAYVLFGSDGLNIGSGRYRTRLILDGKGGAGNNRAVYNRIRAEFVSVGAGDFLMGEADALARPGRAFYNMVSKMTPPLKPTILHGNWGVQRVRQVGAAISINEATAEIQPVTEPPTILIESVGVIVMFISMRRSSISKTP